jgi:sporulation protein YlmC with PRC-barrel domain
VFPKNYPPISPPTLYRKRVAKMKNITINFNEKEVVDLVIALNNYNTLKEKTKDLQALTSVNTILTKIKNVSQYRLNKRNKVAQ